MRRRAPAVAVAAVLAVGVAGFVWHRAVEEERGSAPHTGAQVDPSVPEYKLLQDALDMTAARQAGSVNFSYVPRTRPPGLLRMHIGGHGDAVTDTYQFGPQKLQAIAAFSETPSETCEYLRKGEVSGLCVRDTATSPVPAQPGFRHVVVYFTGNVAATPDTGDPQTAAAKRFWAGTEMVPVESAGWFTDLVARDRDRE